MNEIWHNTREPNYNTLVVIINGEGRIVYFGYYGPHLIENDERWTYMTDLVNKTTKKDESQRKKTLIGENQLVIRTESWKN